MKWIIPGALLVLLVGGAVAPLAAQSLADVARQEEERRKALKVPGKVYTNGSLRAEPAPATPSPASGQTGPSTAPVPPAAAPPAGAPSGAQPPAAGQPAAGQPAAPTPQTEAEWKTRMATARDALTRSQTFADALQSRINALSTDFVNRDDPAQRDQIAADRQRALIELDRVRRDMQDQQKAIAAIQEEARKAGVPAGWVR